MIWRKPRKFGAWRPATTTYSATGTPRVRKPSSRLIAALSRGREGPAHTGHAVRRAAACLSRRRAAGLGAGGTALCRTLGPQLGARRFQRSQAAGGDCDALRRGRHRAQSAACAVRGSRRAGEPLRAQQPAVSQSALYRCRGDSGISGRHRGGARGRAERIARNGHGRLCSAWPAPSSPACAWPMIAFASRQARNAARISKPSGKSRAKRCCALPASKSCASATRRSRGRNGRIPWRHPDIDALQDFRRTHSDALRIP